MDIAEFVTLEKLLELGADPCEVLPLFTTGVVGECLDLGLEAYGLEVAEVQNYVLGGGQG